MSEEDVERIASKNRAKKEFLCWAIGAVVLWVLPTDDVIENSLGLVFPASLIDECLATIMAIIKGFRLALVLQTLKGAEQYAGVAIDNLTVLDEDSKGVVKDVLNKEFEAIEASRSESMMGVADDSASSESASADQMNLF